MPYHGHGRISRSLTDRQHSGSVAGLGRHHCWNRRGTSWHGLCTVSSSDGGARQVLGFVLVLALSGVGSLYSAAIMLELSGVEIYARRPIEELQLPSMDEQFTLERSAPKKIIVPVLPPSLGTQGSEV